MEIVRFLFGSVAINSELAGRSIVSQHHITTGVEEMAEVYTVIDFDVHTSDNIRLIGISYQVL